MAEEGAQKRPLEDEDGHVSDDPDQSTSTALVVKKARLEDSQIVASTTKDGIKRTSDLMAPTMQLTGHGGEVYGLEFSPDGQHLASASFDKQIFLWRVFGECENFGVLKVGGQIMGWGCCLKPLSGAGMGPCMCAQCAAVWERGSAFMQRSTSPARVCCTVAHGDAGQHGPADVSAAHQGRLPVHRQQTCMAGLPCANPCARHSNLSGGMHACRATKTLCWRCTGCQGASSWSAAPQTRPSAAGMQ